MVTMDNYEEYLALYADGELVPAQQQELEAFIQQHPHLRAEMEAYGQARITADDTLVYPDKRSLLKQEEAPKVVPLNRTWIYSMAAAVLLIITIATLYRYNKTGDTNNIEVAKTTLIPPAVHTTVVPQPIDTAIQAPPQTNLPQETAIASHKNTAQKRKSNYNTPNEPIQDPAPQPTLRENEQPTGRLATQPAREVKSLPIEDKMQPVQVPEVAALIQAGPAPEKQKRSFLDSLPLDDDKKKGLETVASAIETISDTKLSVTITNKQLVINF